MRLSLRQRLFALTAAVLLPAVAVTAFNEYQDRSDRVREVHEQALRQGRLASLELDRILGGVENILQTAASADEIRGGAGDTCQKFLARVVAQVASLNAIAVFKLNGDSVCNSSIDAPLINVADRSYFGEALRTGKFTIGTMVESRTNKRRVLPVALPLRDDGGQVQGLITTSVRLDWLAERLKERGLTRGGALTVADRDGTIIFREPLAERFVGTRIPASFLKLVYASSAGTTEVKSQDGVERIIGYVPVGEAPVGLYVSYGLSKEEAFAALNRASVFTSALMLLAAITAFILAAYVGRAMIQRPIQRLLDVVAAWRRRDFTARTATISRDAEFATIGGALDAMMDELRQRDEQRELASRELSHRVKNTLAIVQAIANQTFRGAVDEHLVRSFASRVTALAGAYDVLLAEEWSGGGLRDVLEKTLAPHTDHADRFRLSGPSLTLPAHLVLSLSMVVHELATNSVKYGALGDGDGYVDIKWEIDQTQGRVELSWSEHDGPPVVPPAGEGFGTKLISRAFPSDARPEVQMHYEADGVRCSLAFDLQQASKSEAQNEKKLASLASSPT